MLTIAWDVDDILNDLMGCWLEQQWKREHPQCELTYHDIKQNGPQELLGVPLQDYLNSLDEFRQSPAFPAMKPNPLVMGWFKRYGSQARHIVLTAVPLSCAHISAEWVVRHFGKWIRTFHFVPSFREGVDVPDYDLRKAEFLQWISKVDVLVEDNGKNASEAAEAGVQGLLVDRPWNSSNRSMEEVLAELTGLLS